MSDLLVVGLDLATGRQVHVDERPVIAWKTKDHTGDQTLVCLHCYQGIDVPAPRQVPLVAKGRIGGIRRAHFAHPPGQAPAGGHHPETTWHALGKALLVKWARRQPGVRDAWAECWTADRTRRSDVTIEFTTGNRLALELQHSQLTDAEWLHRHTDYRTNNIIDVWLWDPATGVPGIVHATSQPGWIFDTHHQRIRQHPAPTNTTRGWVPLTELRLSPNGLHINAPHRPSAPPTPPPTASRHRRWLPAPRSTDSRGLNQPHYVVRIDALPPSEDPAGRDRYLCVPCNQYLTGIELAADSRHLFDHDAWHEWRLRKSQPPSATDAM
jgi:hypothetical protein